MTAVRAAVRWLAALHARAVEALADRLPAVGDCASCDYPAERHGPERCECEAEDCGGPRWHDEADARLLAAFDEPYGCHAARRERRP